MGEAVDGELVGTKLEFVPSWMMSWAQWQELHPDTLALDKQGRRGARDSYDGYYASSRTHRVCLDSADNRRTHVWHSLRRQ